MSEKDREQSKEGQDLGGRDSRLTAAQAAGYIRSQLEEAGIEDVQAESFIILEWICGINRETYFLDPGALVSPEKMSRLHRLLAERKRHVPLQYLMGSAPFMGYTFFVNEHVLIPRQDTECLVERSLELLKEFPAYPSLDVLDLCTGSGCIGISIKKAAPAARVLLSDISKEALAIARKNALALDADVEICQGDLFEPVKGSYHMIISNPPYIPSAKISELMPEVRDYEPGQALDGGRDGLDFYRRIVHGAKDYLKDGGYLLFEIGMDQGPALEEIFMSEGYKDIMIRKDLAGLDRTAEGRF